MRKSVLAVIAFLFMVSAARANQRAYGFCTAGDASVSVSGLTGIPDALGSYAGCTVTVYISGTLTLATIYSNNNSSPTPLSNPFQANTTTGYWDFYASNARYDVVISPTVSLGQTFSAFTYSDIILSDPGGLLVGSFLAVPYASPAVFSASAATVQQMTLSGNVTASSVTNPTLGQFLTFDICQDSGGGFSFSWPSNFVNAPTVTGTASACTVATFVYDNSNSWRAVSSGGGGGGSGTVQAAPQFHLYLQPNSGSQAVAGPSNITTDATLSALNVPGGIQTTDSIFAIPAVPATSSANQLSPPIGAESYFWNGTSGSNLDGWGPFINLGTGTNPQSEMLFEHFGSPGPLTIAFEDTAFKPITFNIGQSGASCPFALPADGNYSIYWQYCVNGTDLQWEHPGSGGVGRFHVDSDFLVGPPGTATSGGNFNSFAWDNEGSYWDGTQAQNDLWEMPVSTTPATGGVINSRENLYPIFTGTCTGCTADLTIGGTGVNPAQGNPVTTPYWDFLAYPVSDGHTLTLEHTMLTANRLVNFPDNAGIVAESTGSWTVNDCLKAGSATGVIVDTGAACGGGGTPAGAQFDLQDNGTGTAFGNVAAPAGPFIGTVKYEPPTSTKVAPQVYQDGVTPVSLNGTTSAYTFAYTDDINLVIHDKAATGTVNATLPTPTTLNNPGFASAYCNSSAQTDTITPVTWTISLDNGAAGASISVAPGRCVKFAPDSFNANQWDAFSSGLQGGGGLSGMTAGQIPVAATATTVTSSIPLLGTDTNIPTAATIGSQGAIACADANGGLTTATSSCGTGVAATVASVQFTSGTFRGGSVAQAVVYQGGQDNTSTTPGAATFRGADITGGAAAIVMPTITYRGGNDASTNASSSPSPVIFSSGSATAANNLAGADATYECGTGTGTSTPCHVLLKSPAILGTSGATNQVEVTRHVIHTKTGLTSGSATNIASIALAADQSAGLHIEVHVEAHDTTNHHSCSTVDVFDIVAQDTGGTVTTNVSSAVGLATICDSTNTLTMSVAASAAAPSMISVTPTLTGFTATQFWMTVKITNLSQQDITLQ